MFQQQQVNKRTLLNDDLQTDQAATRPQTSPFSSEAPLKKSKNIRGKKRSKSKKKKGENKDLTDLNLYEKIGVQGIKNMIRHKTVEPKMKKKKWIK